VARRGPGQASPLEVGRGYLYLELQPPIPPSTAVPPTQILELKPLSIGPEWSCSPSPKTRRLDAARARASRERDAIKKETRRPNSLHHATYHSCSPSAIVFHPINPGKTRLSICSITLGLLAPHRPRTKIDLPPFLPKHKHRNSWPCYGFFTADRCQIAEPISHRPSLEAKLLVRLCDHPPVITAIRSCSLSVLSFALPNHRFVPAHD
jgi:hypothetical protein